MLHEGEHLRRRDDWTNLLQKICLVLFPLNPALVWMERRLGREREMACDDGVVSVTHAPRAYAACLASLAECGLKYRTGALTLGAWQRRPELVERVHAFCGRKARLSPMETAGSCWWRWACGLCWAGIELARCPQLVAFVSPVNQVSNGLSASTRMAGAEPAACEMVNADVLSGAKFRAVLPVR